MAGFTVQRSGYTRVPELFYAITQDLLANGFTMVFPTTPLLAPVAGTPYTSIYKVTLAATAAIDPLIASQPWSIQFNVRGTQFATVTIATPVQLTADGKAALVQDAGSDTGMLSPTLNWSSYGNATDDPANTFIARGATVTSVIEASYPFSYRISTSSNGVVVAIWADASDAATTIQAPSAFQWFCVQRPVDHSTGSATIPATVHAPLFCVFGMNAKVYKFVVREADVLKPSVPVDATTNTVDSQAIINGTQQVAITETNQYVITFPNGLNTQRYMYTTELDMIAYTSADVISAFTDVPLTVYGEASARSYKALNANGINNTGMRMLMLTAGGPML